MAEKKKKKSRIKRLLKTLGKAAILGGTAYGASKLFGGSRPSGFLKSGAAGGASLAGDRAANAKRLMTSNRAYTGRGYDDPIMTGGVGVKGPGARTWDSYLPWNTDRYKKGGRVKKAKVTGIAKRGFGRALMKGKK
jgi:hypothetical protein